MRECTCRMVKYLQAILTYDVECWEFTGINKEKLKVVEIDYL